MKKFNIIFAVMAVFVLAVSSAFAAPGDTTQNQPSLSSYDAPVYATPVVDASGNHTLTVTNTHTPEVVDVTVTKIWDDDDNRDNLRPSNICVTLTATANGGAATGEVYNYTLSTSDADANDDNQWSHTFEDLVKFYDGYQIAYTVAEADGTCTAITYTEDNCELSGGRWENSACTPYTPPSQTSGGNSGSGDSGSGDSGSGSTTPDYASLTTQAACEAATPAGTWTAGSCSDSNYNEEADCTSNSGTWTAGSCAAPATTGD